MSGGGRGEEVIDREWRRLDRDVSPHLSSLMTGKRAWEEEVGRSVPLSRRVPGSLIQAKRRRKTIHSAQIQQGMVGDSTLSGPDSVPK